LELDLDDNGDYWVSVHTGSRNFGLKIAEHYQNIARKELVNVKEVVNGLEYLTGNAMEEYIVASKAANEFASTSRKIILKTLVDDFFKEKLSKTGYVESVHNYVDVDNKIIRKGAVSAYKDEDVIIPWNMKDGIIICKGKGNEEWNCSAPHGAGRLLSRGNAKRTLSMEDYKSSMKDVWSSCISAGTIDESPMAYKKPEIIKGYIQDTVEVILTMKPVYNFKADD
jgi:tRNA-splicing ligase RtcB (3'-phosphate/5'-hydroxy nucleic acid ligase)